MQYKEYGKEHQEVIVLLHGGGLSWWNYTEVAMLLQTEYRVIIPILDGHAESDRAFTTVEDNAEEIIAWIDRECGGSVLLIGGLSLGGQILLEMLAQRRDICRYAMVESALVLPSKLAHALIKPCFGSCYGLIRQKWFAVLQFKYLRIRKDLFEDYFRDTCAITKSDMIAFLQANLLYSMKETVGDSLAKICVVAGERENSAIKKSAELIRRGFKRSSLQILPRLSHGEFSINHPADYVKILRKLIKTDGIDEKSVDIPIKR